MNAPIKRPHSLPSTHSTLDLFAPRPPKRPRVVDYFAGLGGFTEGATQAGCVVVEAINHWPVAVEWHSRNHPNVTHRCEDLTRFNPSRLAAFDILAASCACQGHSPARGVERGSEEDAQWDDSRATAWSIVDCAEVRKPRGIVVENVPGYLKWRLFPLWQKALESLGYKLRVQVVCGSRFGLAQERERVIITASLNAQPEPIVLPELPMVTAADVIDMSAGRWSKVNRPGRAAATLARIARGRAAHGERFTMPYYKSGTCRAMNRPLGTITTRDRWAIVDGDRMRMLRVEEYREVMGFPVGYQLPKGKGAAVHLLGNAIIPAVAAAGLRSVMEVM